MRKLSLHENLRHRLNDSLGGSFGSSKSRRLQRDLTRKLNKKFKKDVKPALRKSLKHLPRITREPEHSTAQSILMLTLGVAAGVAAGIAISQKLGGFGAMADKMKKTVDRDETQQDETEDRYARAPEGHDANDEFYEDDDKLSPMEELEERVLETYRNDPILRARAIDIGAIEEGVIELTGWVHAADETTHAVTVARGTPGVITVVNRLAVRADDDRLDDADSDDDLDDDDLLMADLDDSDFAGEGDEDEDELDLDAEFDDRKDQKYH